MIGATQLLGLSLLLRRADDRAKTSIFVGWAAAAAAVGTGENSPRALE